MQIEKSERGFEFLEHPPYLPNKVGCDRIASQSSAIGDYEDSMDNPGSSFLWIGDDHHLSREEVTEFVQHLQRWLDTGYMGEQSEES